MPAALTVYDIFIIALGREPRPDEYDAAEAVFKEKGAAYLQEILEDYADPFAAVYDAPADYGITQDECAADAAFWWDAKNSVCVPKRRSACDADFMNGTTWDTDNEMCKDIRMFRSVPQAYVYALAVCALCIACRRLLLRFV